jgi:hypothetical protein
MINHSIAPPSKLVSEWANMLEYRSDERVFSEVAQWGADQELEACSAQISQCGLLTNEQRITIAEYLHCCRRPKPPSLKEQALKELKDWTDEKHGPGGEVFLCEGLSVVIIRRALEALPND